MKVKVDWGTTPQWSKDDSQLLFHNSSDEVVIANASTGSCKVLTKGTYPSWEPSGDRVTYKLKQSYWSTNLSGGDPVELLKSDWATMILEEPLRYSPDGKFAVYVRGYATFDLVEHEELMVVRLLNKSRTSVFCTTGRWMPLTWAVIAKP
jgi:hypothetical protein